MKTDELKKKVNDILDMYWDWNDFQQEIRDELMNLCDEVYENDE